MQSKFIEVFYTRHCLPSLPLFLLCVQTSEAFAIHCGVLYVEQKCDQCSNSMNPSK